MRKTKIALVQMNSLLGQTKTNLQKIKYFTTQASRQNVDIICFPELAVQSYSRDQSHLYAEEIPGPSSIFISNLAKTQQITILSGIAEKSPVKDKPYITHLTAFPDGSVARYRKTHLGSSEQPYFTSGNSIDVFTLDKVNFGIQICWDLHFPEISTIMSLKGAEIIFAPHASPRIAGNRKEMWSKYINARAYDNAVFVVTCNLIGPNGQGSHFSGGAMVIDPKGNIIAEDFNNQESMLVTELDEKLINLIRYKKATSMKNIFYLKARRPELYKELGCSNMIKNNV